MPVNQRKVDALIAAQAKAGRGLLAKLRAIFRPAMVKLGDDGWYAPEVYGPTAQSFADRSLAAQKARAAVTARFTRAILHELGDDVNPLVDVTDLRGVDPLTVWSRPMEEYRYQVSRGKSPADALELAARRAELIADDDLQLADRKASQIVMAASVKTIGYRRVIHPELSAGGTCGLCIAASTRKYRVEELRAIHENCVPPWAIVAADGVLAITRREYSGELVIFSTASGQEFSVTPNHPVLTNDGWVPAGFIQTGDNVVRHREGHGVVGRRPNEDKKPATVEQVWRSATVDNGLNPRVVPLSTEDFHGDGSDGEVEIVSTSRRLAGIGDVSFAEPLSERQLVARHRFRVGLPRASSRFEAALHRRLSANRGIRGRGKELAVLSASPDVAGSGSLGLIAAGNSRRFQPKLDHWTTRVELGRDGEFAHPANVSVNDLVNRNLGTERTRFDPAGFEFSGEGRHAYARLGRSLLQRLAGNVELDSVVHLERRSFVGHVYNLHTIEGWYSSDNHIVSNCKCTSLPITADDDLGDVLNTLDLRKLYADNAGSTDGRQLKYTRYQVNEHGELGPVLRRKGDNFRGPSDVKDATGRPARKSRDQLVAELQTLLRQKPVDPVAVKAKKQEISRSSRAA